jgi:hypothetical protein
MYGLGIIRALEVVNAKVVTGFGFIRREHPLLCRQFSRRTSGYIFVAVSLGRFVEGPSFLRKGWVLLVDT